MRSLVSLATLVLLYGHLSARSPLARATVVLSILPIVVIANGLRVTAAGVVAHAYGGDAASGFLHTFSGWLFFAASAVLLIVVERGVTLFGRSWPRLGWRWARS